MKKVFVAHGAILNSGDFYILEQSMKLLKDFLDDDFELIPVPRWEKIQGDCDFLIIAGGPIITRNLHNQAKNIRDYLEANPVPVACLGVGIGGKHLSGVEQFFKDQESIEFWSRIAESSGLFSVRDSVSHNVLKGYGIDTIITGCPGLYDIETLKTEPRNRTLSLPTDVTATIPKHNVPLNLVKTFYFLIFLKLLMKDIDEFNEVFVVFQHGYKQTFDHIAWLFCKTIGLRPIDASSKSISQIEEIKNSDLHVGTRLHMGIYFLSRNRKNYLLNVDARTDSFIKTVPTPNNQFNYSGIFSSLKTLKKHSQGADGIFFSNSIDNISEIFQVMQGFLESMNNYIFNLN